MANEIAQITPERKEKAKNSKTIITNELLSEIITEVADNKSINGIMKSFHIGYPVYKDILIKYGVEIENKRRELQSFREKQINPMLLKSISESITDLLDKKKYNKAKFAELCRGIESLHKMLRLNSNQSTENVGIDIANSDRESLIRYINGSETIDNISSESK